MTRVLLFVQNDWNKRPPRATGGRVRRTCDDAGVPLLSHVQMAARDAADRWWLVECENADSGRNAIKQAACAHQTAYYTLRCLTCGLLLGKHYGRILDSGGNPVLADRRAHPRLAISAPLSPGDIPGRNA